MTLSKESTLNTLIYMRVELNDLYIMISAEYLVHLSL